MRAAVKPATNSSDDLNLTVSCKSSRELMPPDWPDVVPSGEEGATVMFFLAFAVAIASVASDFGSADMDDV